MIKRVSIAFALTVLVTVALGFLYVWLTDTPYVGLDGARFLAGTISVCSAALLCRRSFRWPELLFCSCAIALFVGASVDLFVSIAVMHQRNTASVSSFLFYGCQVNPLVNKPASASAVGYLLPDSAFCDHLGTGNTRIYQAMEPRKHSGLTLCLVRYTNRSV